MARRTPSQINLLIAVDKPVGMSSHDVVSRVRRAVGERRVGHAGTLDPLASGVMVVGIGQATRLLGMITLDRKRYLARIAFGTETVTDDAEGEVSRVSDPARATGDLADEGFARKALSGFLGAQMQVPPAYSAISVGGVRSYRRARSGEDFELPPRPIEVYAADLVAIEAGETPVWDVSFDVSKGAYIRSLARDLGRACGSAAHLDGLRRTRSGSISLSSCLPLDEVGLETVRPRALDPVGVLGMSARLRMSDAAGGSRSRDSAVPCPQATAPRSRSRTRASFAPSRASRVRNWSCPMSSPRESRVFVDVCRYPTAAAGLPLARVRGPGLPP